MLLVIVVRFLHAQCIFGVYRFKCADIVEPAVSGITRCKIGSVEHVSHYYLLRKQYLCCGNVTITDRKTDIESFRNLLFLQQKALI